MYLLLHFLSYRKGKREGIPQRRPWGMVDGALTPWLIDVAHIDLAVINVATIDAACINVADMDVVPSMWGLPTWLLGVKVARVILPPALCQLSSLSHLLVPSPPCPPLLVSLQPWGTWQVLMWCGWPSRGLTWRRWHVLVEIDKAWWMSAWCVVWSTWCVACGQQGV